MGLTTRSVALTALMTLVTLGVIVLALASFSQYRSTVTSLAEDQTRGLLTASRLLQQSESMVASSAMLLLAENHFHRRQAMFEIGDRREWIDRLASELIELRGSDAHFEEIFQARERLVENLAQLDRWVQQRIDLRADLRSGVGSPGEPDQADLVQLADVEARIAELIRANRMLSRDLGVAVSFHVGDIRHDIQQTVDVLEKDIARRETILKSSVVGVILVVLATVVFIQRSVVGRLVTLQRAIARERPVADDIAVMGRDEIARMAQTIRHYVARINHNEQRIMAMNDELDFLATHDALTQLKNRHYFERTLNTYRESLEDQPYCVAMIDIDNFKLVNDRHGHDVGDEVIRWVADLLQANMPEGSLLARYGGEEFVALFPGEAAPLAQDALERTRERISAAPFVIGDQPITVSVSIGLASRLPGGDYALTLKAADESLYQAKRQGRNRLVVRRRRQDDEGGPR
ncbi:GGDEF domain-containing protein [Halomonas urumqiensis]|uniref:diguanylate cyclase n=1 Tax=Halomonas urumqiensis TaxID=1684789 RepID=A0A2N7UE04_9GAMM|nr:GGDEF domain-containing protein [Halomonas urumqiensis]PMR78615.1 hypothetical protein C1H70_17940 [Halomonas urumqiensis]PTB03759.1 hypothetical protein C6V82_04570 [Halomonas urumqiensis]GHE20015.1 hypothetical protein GCM10017767_05360 [Halomonas urumqiensis]